MPNSVLPFHINNCKVTPNGINAQMSITGSNGQSNQGTWKNNDTAPTAFALNGTACT